MTLIRNNNKSVYTPVRDMETGQAFIGKLTGHTFLLISKKDGWLSYYDFNENAVSVYEEVGPEGIPVSIISMEIE